MVKAIKITLLSLLIVCLVAVMIGFMTGNFKFGSKAKLVYDEEFALEDVKNFDIDVKSLDIKIEESNSDKVRIKIYANEKDDVDVSKDNEQNILIKQNNRISCIGFCFNPERDITIYLPKDYDGEFNIKATSGDIESEVINNLVYKINVTSGDIDIKNAKSIEGKTTSGDLELGTITSFIKYKTTSGDFEIDRFTLEKDSSIETTSGDVEIDNISNAYVDAHATSGDIKIKNNDRHAEYELKIKTTSGDITVR